MKKARDLLKYLRRFETFDELAECGYADVCATEEIQISYEKYRACVAAALMIIFTQSSPSIAVEIVRILNTYTEDEQE